MWYICRTINNNYFKLQNEGKQNSNNYFTQEEITAAARETSVSWHNGVQIKYPIRLLIMTVLWWSEGFQGGLHMGILWYRKMLFSRITKFDDGCFPVRDKNYFSETYSLHSHSFQNSMREYALTFYYLYLLFFQ